MIDRHCVTTVGAGDHHEPLPAQAGVPAPLSGQHRLPHRIREEPHGAHWVRHPPRKSKGNVVIDQFKNTNISAVHRQSYLIGRSVSLSGTPSKYSFAAHMGHLMRGVEGQGCHHFYPECPFSNQDVLQIAKRITFK